MKPSKMKMLIIANEGRITMYLLRASRGSALITPVSRIPWHIMHPDWLPAVQGWIGTQPSLQSRATLHSGKVAGEEKELPARAERRTGAALAVNNADSQGGTGQDAVWCGGLMLRERRWGRGIAAEEKEEEEARGLMARGSGSGRWSRQRMGLFNAMLRCNLPPETQKIVVFFIMMLLIIINVVLMFLLAFQ
ncbi:uncharacterized protein V6R79_022019 [Siganus canaliculatus]